MIPLSELKKTPEYWKEKYENEQWRNKQLQAENERLKDNNTIIKSYAEKFVRKVEEGKARSKETYKDMKHVIELTTKPK